MAGIPITSVFDRGVLAIAAVFAVVAGSFAAGAGGPDTETEMLARQEAIDQPQLWRVDVLGEADAVKASVFVCADTSLRETFVRTRAEVNGEPCTDATEPILKENGWALLCVAARRLYSVSASTVGDPTQDFRLSFGLTQLYDDPTVTGPGRITVGQIRHFHRTGACPAGWRIGDQAKPGHRPRKAA